MDVEEKRRVSETCLCTWEAVCLTIRGVKETEEVFTCQLQASVP